MTLEYEEPYHQLNWLKNEMSYKKYQAFITSLKEEKIPSYCLQGLGGIEKIRSNLKPEKEEWVYEFKTNKEGSIY